MKQRLLSICAISVLLIFLLVSCAPQAEAPSAGDEEAAAEEVVEEVEEPAVVEEPAEEQVEEAVEEVAEDDGLVCGMTAEELDAKIEQYQGGYERPEWTDQQPEETVRIAFLSYQNNPFWIQQKVGVTQAQGEIEELGLDAVVDFVVVAEDLDPTKMVAAIETAQVQEYDAMIMFPVNESIVDALNKVAESGTVIGHFATDVEGSPRTVFIGQDLFNAGKMAGYLMIKATGGEGKVGIITGQFGATAHELRQAGFEEALSECPNMEIVGVEEAHDSSDETYTHAQNFMSANPDLAGLFMTAGGPFGAGRAIEEANKVGEIYTVGFDVTEQHIPYVENGSMITIHQHEPWQSHDNIVFIYNYLVTGEKPDSEIFYTPAEVVTKDNVDQFWPSE